MPPKPPSPEATVTDQTLEKTPERALHFLRALNKAPVIVGTLRQHGYTEADHAEGWSLLLDVSGYTPPGAPPTKGASDAATGLDATATLDAWDEDGFAVVHATLARRFPDQAAFVFADGLRSSQGAQAVLGVSKLAARLRALKSSPERKATRKQDHAALAKLAERGIDEDKLSWLEGLVARAQAMAPEAAPGPSAEDTAKARAQLVALRAWLVEWSTIARAVVKRRDHLIALGLANRKKRASKKATTPEAEEE